MKTKDKNIQHTGFHRNGEAGQEMKAQEYPKEMTAQGFPKEVIAQYYPKEVIAQYHPQLSRLNQRSAQAKGGVPRSGEGVLHIASCTARPCGMEDPSVPAGQFPFGLRRPLVQAEQFEILPQRRSNSSSPSKLEGVLRRGEGVCEGTAQHCPKEMTAQHCPKESTPQHYPAPQGLRAASAHAPVSFAATPSNLEGELEILPQAEVTQFSSSREEEYPKGEVVGKSNTYERMISLPHVLYHPALWLSLIHI